MSVGHPGCNIQEERAELEEALWESLLEGQRRIRQGPANKFKIFKNYFSSLFCCGETP